MVVASDPMTVETFSVIHTYMMNTCVTFHEIAPLSKEILLFL